MVDAQRNCSGANPMTKKLSIKLGSWLGFLAVMLLVVHFLAQPTLASKDVDDVAQVASDNIEPETDGRNFGSLLMSAFGMGKLNPCRIWTFGGRGSEYETTALPGNKLNLTAGTPWLAYEDAEQIVKASTANRGWDGDCEVVINSSPALRLSLPGSSPLAADHNPDRDVLVKLYQATGGTQWTNNHNWLSDASLNTWYGVATDDFGRVTE